MADPDTWESSRGFQAQTSMNRFGDVPSNLRRSRRSHRLKMAAIDSLDIMRILPGLWRTLLT
jgi:hypothetical protein